MASACSQSNAGAYGGIVILFGLAGTCCCCCFCCRVRLVDRSRWNQLLAQHIMFAAGSLATGVFLDKTKKFNQALKFCEFIFLHFNAAVVGLCADHVL